MLYGNVGRTCVGLVCAALVAGCADADSIKHRVLPLRPVGLESGCGILARDAGETCDRDGGERAICGDMEVTWTGGEECEPPGTPTCDSTCRRRPTACGDSIVDEGEECDDGNTLSGDGCSDRCLGEACGNGRVDVADQCEPPNTASCDAECKVISRLLRCGNGTLDPEEECEVSTAVAGDGCNASCQTEHCGNNRVDKESGETCEPPGTAICSANCRVLVPPTVACGNFDLQAPEECDDGNAQAGDGCSATCLGEVCGNGRLDHRETCEPPNTAACSSTCVELSCGDGVVTAALGEECDDRTNAAGTPVSGDGCSAICLKEECGNGRIDTALGEQCEPPETPTCNADCHVILPAFCGDNTVQPPEECDDGNRADGDNCDSDCRRVFCGNGRVEPPEACDPPGTATCDRDCRRIVPTCGNRTVEMPEECDDGNLTAGDGCNAACHLELCNNGRVDFVGECEPPRTTSCTDACRPINPVCGDGKVEGREECEDGGNPPVGGDGCSAFCFEERCGNGTLDVGEQCEPPSVNRCGASCRLLP